MLIEISIILKPIKKTSTMSFSDED